jgi:hypothetical protein
MSFFGSFAREMAKVLSWEEGISSEPKGGITIGNKRKQNRQKKTPPIYARFGT